MTKLARLGPFLVRADGTLLLNVMLTFKPGRDDAKIRRIQEAPKRGIASVILAMMNEGAQAGASEEDDELDLNGLAEEI